MSHRDVVKAVEKLCETCIHRKVCKKRDLKLEKAVDILVEKICGAICPLGKLDFCRKTLSNRIISVINEFILENCEDYEKEE